MSTEHGETNPRRNFRQRSWNARHGEPYELLGTGLIGPSLPGDVVVAETADEVIDLLGADLVVHAENCVRQFGDFHLALSGCAALQPLYERLMYDPDFRRLPWRRTHLWLVEEKCVSFDHPQCTFKTIDETIVDHADIPREQVHPIFATSQEADLDYEKELKEALAWREKGQDRLDFVLLGLGLDGHTAGLFPDSEPLNETNRLVRFNSSKEGVAAERVTMTFPVINSARFIAVLATGGSMRHIIKRLATDQDTAQHLPIKGLSPLNGELRWYLDAEACGGDDHAQNL